MNLMTLPLRNLRRRMLRTLLLVLVLSVGIVSVVALNYLSAAVGESLEKKLTAYGANILITPRTEHLAIGYGGMQLGDVSYGVKHLDQQKAAEAVHSIALGERISAVAPKLALLTEVGGSPVAVIGVDWPQELAIKSYWTVDGAYPQGDDAHSLLAGSDAARVLGLSVGDVVSIDEGSFTVAGILRSTGSEDDQVLFATLSGLQEATGNQGKVHFLEVSALCSGCPIEDIVAQIRTALPGVEVQAMQQVVRRRMETVSFVKRMAMAVSAVIVLTACFMIGLSMYSAVNERKKEIGLLRAVGFGKGAVFAVFCLEAVMVGALAAIIGYVGGFVLGHELLDVLDAAQGAELHFAPEHFAATLAGVVALSLIASVFPAFRAARVEPNQALVML